MVKKLVIGVVIVVIICAGIGMMIWESSDHSKTVVVETKKEEDEKIELYPVQQLEELQGETIRLVLYDEMSSYNGLQEGWFAKILLEQFNIELDIRTLTNKPDIKECDMHVWSSENSYDSNADQSELKSFNDKFIATYGVYMYQKYQDNFIYSDSNNTKYCGFKDFNQPKQIWTVGKYTKHEELVMCFMDWMASEEGRYICKYGPKDLCWDYDEDGNMFLTEFGKSCQERALKDIPKEYGGGTFYDGRPICSMKQ